jgi:hypothetical protein
LTTLILGFPWNLADDFNADSGAFMVVRDFNKLVSKLECQVAPIVTSSDLDESRARLYGKVSGNIIAQWYRVANQLGSLSEYPSTTATPIPEPKELTSNWKAALRHSFQDLNDWRAPQIVVPKSRSAEWAHGPLIRVQSTDFDDTRVLVRLDDYDAHDCARSDFDPWDMRRAHPLDANSPNNHECRLPKPPMLRGVRLSDLNNALIQSRAGGWQISGRLYFIPPQEWQYGKISREQCLGGHPNPAV